MYFLRSSCLLIPFCIFMLFSCVTNQAEIAFPESMIDGIYVAFGTGITKEEARTDALNSIAEQIEVRITSHTTIEEKETNDDFSLFYEHGVEAISDIILNGATRVSEEKKGGLFYSYYKYDNRPLKLRIRGISNTNGSTSTYNIKPYSLPIDEMLEGNGISNDYLVFHKHGVWYLAIEKNILPISGKELSDYFFISSYQGNIKLVQGYLNGSLITGQPENALKKDQEYFININSPSSGFMNLFYIDNAGVTLSLIANERVEKNEIYIFPDQNVYSGGLIAEPAGGFKYSSDMVLAVFSDLPLTQIEKFQKVSESQVRLDNEKIFAYDKIIEILNSSDFKICSILINVEE